MWVINSYLRLLSVLLFICIGHCIYVINGAQLTNDYGSDEAPNVKDFYQVKIICLKNNNSVDV